MSMPRRADPWVACVSLLLACAPEDPDAGSRTSSGADDSSESDDPQTIDTEAGSSGDGDGDGDADPTATSGEESVELECMADSDCEMTHACVDEVCVALESCAEIQARDHDVDDGVYSIDTDESGPAAPFAAYCDMTIDGGGWTLVLNLDTSDGQVMWWANEAWTDDSTRGVAAHALTADHKSEAWNSLSGADEVLLMVHKQGEVLGWKTFDKVGGATMYMHMQGGDNTLIGGTATAVLLDGQLWEDETLVRESTQLFANRCVDGACVGGKDGAPDGARIGSAESLPDSNTGGGLGNWGDMGSCCGGSEYDGRQCNESAFRTTAEAQSGWVDCESGGTGHFGSDTFGPSSTNMCDESPCANSNRSAPNGYDYDYALWLR